MAQIDWQSIMNGQSQPRKRYQGANVKFFNAVNENEEITIRVIGQRYELNDEQVSVIGEIVEPKTDKIKIDKIKKKPNLVISENI